MNNIRRNNTMNTYRLKILLKTNNNKNEFSNNKNVKKVKIYIKDM